MAVAQSALRSLARRPPAWLRLRVPAWLVSLLFHAALLIALAVTVQVQPRGLPGGAGREGLSLFDAGGIGDGTGDMFDDESAGGGPNATVTLSPAAARDTPSGSQLFDDRPPIDALAALPKAANAGRYGPRGDGLTGATGAGGFTSGSGGGSGTGAAPGPARGVRPAVGHRGAGHGRSSTASRPTATSSSTSLIARGAWGARGAIRR